MDFKNRLKLIEQTLIDKAGLFNNPKYENWTDQELKDHIRKSIEDEFKSKLITDIASAQKWYKHLYENDALTEQEFRLQTKTATQYFAGEFN